MVLPKKKEPLTKEDVLLKKKLKKLFKYEDFDELPNTSSSNSSSQDKPITKRPSTSKEIASNSSETKKPNVVRKKRQASLKTLPAKKLKKSYYETESSSTPNDTYNECCNCSESLSEELNEPKTSKNYKKSKRRFDKLESCEIDACSNCNAEDSDEFEELKELALKMLKKDIRRDNKKKALKSESKSSYTDNKQASKISDKKNKNTRSKQNIVKKSKNNPVKQEKYSCTDCNVSDDTTDEASPSPGCNRKYDKKNSHKSYKCGKNTVDWKAKPVHHFENDEWETESVLNQLNGDTVESVSCEHKINPNMEISKTKSKKNKKTEKKSSEGKVKVKKLAENDGNYNMNGNIDRNSKKSKKLKEAQIIEKKNKEINQQLVAYCNSNLYDNDSDEEDRDEYMKFLANTDKDSDETDETEEDYSLSSCYEYDSEDSDSDDDSNEEDGNCEEDSNCEEDDNSQYTDSSSDNDYDSNYDEDQDYNLNTESDDEDYNLPENYEEDLYIPQGIATKYDINGYDVEFDSENEPQIIEIPTENVEKDISIKNYESEDSCPQLVPISFKNQTTHDLQNNYDFTDTDYSESDYSGCCSEATEGSLCFQENLQPFQPPEATTMLPEIFDLSSENITNTNLILNELDNFDSEYDSERDVDNHPLEKIINKSNIVNSATSYKITTIGGLELDITSKVSQQQLLRKTIKNNISNELNPDSNLDKFETKFYNAIDSCHVLVLLRDPFFIYGTIKLQLISGNIEIFGYQPDLNEILDIFSPRGYGFLDIKPIKNNNFFEKTALANIIFQDNYENIFLKYDLNDIIENYNSKTDALVLLTRNDCNKKIEMLRKYMKENLLPNMNSITLDRPFYASEFILHSLIRIQSQNSIRIDPKWQTIKINYNTKLMIIGGKSVGKSTLTRYLINKNLKIFQKILLIDLDIGQPELFIPQTLSVYVLDRPLLGPGYYLGLEPKKALIFGDINAILSPIDYLNSIQILLKFCQETEEFQNIPWFINTMGYVKGFGNELIAAIIKYLQPTDIIQLQSTKSANNFDYLMYPNIVQRIPMNVYAENDLKINNLELKHHLILFDSIMNGRHISKSSEWDMKSKDMRYAMIVTRLGAALNKFDWLTDVKPVCASIDDIEIISFGQDYLTKEELLDVINANLVYLCNKSPTSTHIDCYGIGIVRGIDRFQKKIYLLPAVPVEILKNVNCFAVCNIPLPSSILLNQGPKVKGIVPYAYNTNKVIASKSVQQLYNRGQKRRSEI